jgi:hypothetical protein
MIWNPGLSQDVNPILQVVSRRTKESTDEQSICHLLGFLHYPLG